MFPVNPSLNSHHDNDGMGRGFGRGFRGRGGIRPGMGRAEFIPAEMAMGAHWVVYRMIWKRNRLQVHGCSYLVFYPKIYFVWYYWHNMLIYLLTHPLLNKQLYILQIQLNLRFLTIL